MKIKKIRRLAITIILIFILIATLFYVGVVVMKIGQKSTAQIKVVKEIKSYGYTLADNEIKLYNNYFNELKDVLTAKEVDEEQYAALITKLFIADFYNLDNKLSRNDIGGLQFIHPDIQDNFILNAKNTLYKYVENNIYGNRKQKLPEVKDVQVDNTKNISYSYGNKKDLSAYKLTLHWEYKFDLGYQRDATIIIVHEGSKLYIVELNKIENNE